MRATERGLLIAATSLLLVVSFALAVVEGELARFEYPGDFAVWAVSFTLAGLLILRAEPHHTIGRLFLWAGLSSAMTMFAFQIGATFFADIRLEQGGYEPGAPIWLEIFDIVFGSGYALVQIIVIAAMARFPDGQWATRWIGWLFWATFPLLVLALLGFPPVAALPVLIIFWRVVSKSQRAGPVQRRQMAWVLLGVGMFLLIGIASIPFPLPGWMVISAVVLVPAGFVVAITRYKLYEIDRIVSRTVTYVVVVGVLGAAYAGLVLVLRSLLPVEGPLPVALSTLAVAFAFFPLLRRVQVVVDRRFFRSRYDAAGVVAAFADELRSTLDPGVAAARTEAVVGQTFQAESVSIWLAEEPA